LFLRLENIEWLLSWLGILKLLLVYKLILRILWLLVTILLLTAVVLLLTAVVLLLTAEVLLLIAVVLLLLIKLWLLVFSKLGEIFLLEIRVMSLIEMTVLVVII
jgi:hypothetical protein